MKKALLFLLILGVGIAIGILGHIIYETRILDSINHTLYTATRDDSLKGRVWLGDADAYAKLQGDYRDYPPENFLFWSMYMANKYDYPYAHEDIFQTLVDTYGGDSALYKMDEKTRSFALSHLKIAAQKGDSSAIKLLQEIKRKQVPADWLK